MTMKCNPPDLKQIFVATNNRKFYNVAACLKEDDGFSFSILRSQFEFKNETTLV